MKQILQSLRTGQIKLADVPAPQVKEGHLLIQTSVSLISAGTERMLVEFGKASWIAKARSQPDKVRMVLEKVRTDGLVATVDAVRSKLDQPLPLGYCQVGTVIEVGRGVTGFAVGDRVVSNGKHAEIVCVPHTLCAKVPDDVSDEQAAFTVLAAIALQGIRLTQPTLGECMVVTGLGLIGLLTVQLLCAHGCRVMGIDPDPARCALARQFGAEVAIAPNRDGNVLAAAQTFSRGRGVDAVLITASTTSNEPVHQAAQMCRKRGRIVLVGVAGLELSRTDFYEKELSFQVSCSYGPGRYDPAYEEKCRDYPVGFVRWTVQRNFEAVLDMLAKGALNVAPLITHRFPFEQAEAAYALLSADTPSLGIVLKYAQDDGARLTQRMVTLGAKEASRSAVRPMDSAPSVAFIGAGNYAGRVLMPAFQTAGARLQGVASGGGISAVHFGRKFGFQQAFTDWRACIEDTAVDVVVIATRHDMHARQVLVALQAGKHVFCEKPLCLREEELAAIEAEAHARPEQVLMVGFNRRFSPHIVRMQELLATVAEPKNFIMTINAGEIPPDHWTQDKEVGGGRIVGECCHFIDLLRHLAGAPIIDIQAVALGPHPALTVREDKATITLTFADGSVGTVHYLANGDKGFPKERLEVFCAGRILQLDNFRILRGWGWNGFSRMYSWRQNKGQVACVRAFLEAVRGNAPAPIALEEIFEVSHASIKAQQILGKQV
ncbi:MAG: dehydrogenase [Chloroflexi bacterium]|nr:MAG: dehydrogenase [Chloroflexota bacterium]